MKWRHWSILIVLLLLNYIIFSAAFTRLAGLNQPQPRPTRTAWPTFQSLEPTPERWVVMPTSTPLPTRTPITPTPTEPLSSTLELTSTVEVTATVQPATPASTEAPTIAPATASPAPATATPPPSQTPVPPTATASAQSHTVQTGETLSQIAKAYGVSVQAIVAANGLADPNHIVTGQVLVIPAPGQVPPTAAATARLQATNTPRPAATKSPTPRPTAQPATATPAPPAATLQFTGEVTWDQYVAPNCGGPAIAKQSAIKDAAGNPVNGVRVEVNCYDNIFISHPSGTPGEYDAGHYDFAFGQTTPQNWTCSARVLDVNGQPVASSAVITVQFDTNDCRPGGSGHQVAIVNWTKHW
jgi:LysM repeat protein